MSSNGTPVLLLRCPRSLPSALLLLKVPLPPSLASRWSSPLFPLQRRVNSYSTTVCYQPEMKRGHETRGSVKTLVQVFASAAARHRVSQRLLLTRREKTDTQRKPGPPLGGPEQSRARSLQLRDTSTSSHAETKRLPDQKIKSLTHASKTKPIHQPATPRETSGDPGSVSSRGSHALRWHGACPQEVGTCPPGRPPEPLPCQLTCPWSTISPFAALSRAPAAFWNVPTRVPGSRAPQHHQPHCLLSRPAPRGHTVLILMEDPPDTSPVTEHHVSLHCFYDTESR